MDKTRVITYFKSNSEYNAPFLNYIQSKTSQ